MGIKIPKELLGPIGFIATEALSLLFDSTADDICACLEKVDESVQQVRDAILGLDLESRSKFRGLERSGQAIEDLKDKLSAVEIFNQPALELAPQTAALKAVLDAIEGNLREQIDALEAEAKRVKDAFGLITQSDIEAVTGIRDALIEEFDRRGPSLAHLPSLGLTGARASYENNEAYTDKNANNINCDLIAN